MGGASECLETATLIQGKIYQPKRKSQNISCDTVPLLKIFHSFIHKIINFLSISPIPKPSFSPLFARSQLDFSAT
jgi:hypothetical protein